MWTSVICEVASASSIYYSTHTTGTAAKSRYLAAFPPSSIPCRFAHSVSVGVGVVQMQQLSSNCMLTLSHVQRLFIDVQSQAVKYVGGQGQGQSSLGTPEFDHVLDQGTSFVYDVILRGYTTPTDQMQACEAHRREALSKPL